MKISDFSGIHPFVRTIKIKKSIQLTGRWEDIEHILVYIAHGSVLYGIGQELYPLQCGDMLLIPPYEVHHIYNQGEDELIQYIFHFDFYMDEERMKIVHKSAWEFPVRPCLPEKEKLLEGGTYKATVPQKDRFAVETLFFRMYQEHAVKRDGWQDMMSGMATQFIFMFLRNCNEYYGTNKNNDTSKPDKLIQSALEYIWIYYGENIQNTVIAELLNVSPNYLTKIFRQKLGISLHRYVMYYRLEQAQAMLASGQYNITEIAQKCGFSSIHVFSKLFCSICQMTPSAYAALPENQARHTMLKYADYDSEKSIFYNE